MRKIIVVFSILILAGCASKTDRLARHGTVAGKPGGFLVASGSHVDQETAMKIALASAEKTCKERGKFHVVYESKTSAEETLVNEKVAKAADLASTAASFAGNFVPGGDILRGKKYAEVTFKCE